MTEVGRLTVRIDADTSGLDKGMKDAQGSVKKFRAAAMPAVKAMAAMTAAAAAATTAVAAFTRAGMNAIDAQAKLARQLDSTIGGVRGLQLAAEDAGVSTNVINGAMERFSARLGEARRGSGQTADALARLGLNASELASMDVDERMATIADRVRELGLSGDQTADVLRQFGIRNREIVNLMRQGGDAIRDARDEIEDYGLAIDSIDAGTIEAANDALSRVGLVVESVRNSLAVEMAPVVLEIADRFNTAAREAGGWGSVVSGSAETGALAIAGVIDQLNDVRIFMKRADVASAELEMAITRAALTIREGIGESLAWSTDRLNDLISTMNRIPGVEIDAASGFDVDGFTSDLHDKLSEQLGRRNLWQLDLNEMLDADSALDTVNQFFDSIEERRQQMADSVGGEGGFLPGFGGDDSEDGTGKQDRQAEELEQLQEHLAGRLEAIRESLMNEQELEVEHHAQKMETLAEIREQELITADEYRRLQEEAELQHLERLSNMEQRAADQRARIQKQEAMKRQQDMSQMWTNLISLTGSNSRKMFEIGKAAAIANAVVSTHQGVARSLAEYPMPWAGVMAGAHLAAGMAQVSSIRSQSFGGGGSVSSKGLGGSVPAQQPTGSPQQPAEPQVVRQITLEMGDGMFSSEQVRGLMDEINNELRRGASLDIQTR